MLPFYITIPVVTAIFNAVVVLVLISQGWKSIVNRYFAIAAGGITLWATGVAVFYSADTQESAQLGLLVFYIAPMIAVLFTSFFAAIFPSRDGTVFNTANVILTLLTIFVAGVIVYDPTVLTESITLQSTGNVLHVKTVGYILYMLYFNYAFITIFIELLFNMRGKTGKMYKQVQYVFIGVFCASIFALTTNLLLPLFDISRYIWLGPVWTLFYIVTISISTVRHQLFDIKLAFVRSLVYFFVLVTLSVGYVFIAYFVSVYFLHANTTESLSVSPINIGLALVLAVVFQPVKRFFDKVTNNIFYQDSYDTDEFYADFNHLLASTVDLRSMLQRAANELASTLKAESGFFFLYHRNDEDAKHYLSAGTDKYERFSPADALLLGESLAAYENENVMVRETLEEDSECYRILNQYHVDVLMPLRHEGRIIGYLSLGPRKAGRYNQRDIDTLTSVSDSLIIAIQNALSVHAVKEINATLQQRIDAATEELRKSNVELQRLDTAKDEFLSIASHQLRTPLTSVKGYISMLLDGDAGRTSESQRYLLSEAFKGSERMVGLINDFLNVSRIQSGRFMIDYKKFDIVELVKDEVDSLQELAKSRGITIDFTSPVDVCVVEADESKIRQVTMNFIDNAIYYSKQSTRVAVSIVIAKDGVEVRVKDSGIGVPAHQQAKLFTKFFRAENARQQRPDGTGVGIYLAKRVIQEHGGKIIFESVEGKGSIFGYSIPRRARPSAK